MALINLVFNHELNVSVQVGDVVYYIDNTPVGQPRTWAQTTTPHISGDREDVIMIGPVTAIIPWNGTVSIIEADFDDNLAAQYGPPTSNSFIMFSTCCLIKHNKTLVKPDERLRIITKTV